MFGQEGLRWRMQKDIEDLQLANCSTLYSAVFDSVHSYISWGSNFVGSPGHEIYAPQKFDTKVLPHENFYDYGKIKMLQGTGLGRSLEY